MAKKKSAKAEAETSAATDQKPADSGASPPPASPPTPAARKRFQIFERATCRRSALTFPEVNPRTIDRHAFKKLKEYLKKKGLKTALAVNRRRAANGFPPSEEGRLVIIGGNQRTRAMDELSNYPAGGPAADYEVPIDIEEVSPAQEKEDIIALNNPGMQGAFDYDLLADMLVYPGVNPLDTGFDRGDLAMLLDAGVLESILGTDNTVAQQAAAESATIDILSEISEAGREADRAERDAERAQNSPASAASGNPDSSEPQPGDEEYDESQAQGQAEMDPEAAREAELQGMRDRRVAYQEKMEDQNQASFMIVLVGDNDDEVRRLLTKINLDPTQPTVPLRSFLDAAGVSHLLDS